MTPEKHTDLNGQDVYTYNFQSDTRLIKLLGEVFRTIIVLTSYLRALSSIRCVLH